MTSTHRPDLHDLGLRHDLRTMLSRRRALGLLAGAGATAFLAACGSDDAGTAATTAAASGGSGTSATTAAGAATTAASTGTTAAATSETTAAATSETTAAPNTSYEVIPEETAGPFPGDGSNGPNVLDDSGVVRSDIRSSFGSSSTTAAGVPTTMRFRLVDTTGKPLAGAALYLWHCDIAGGYSVYSDGITEENYLRGVQEADEDGVLSFTTVFPGCYPGRWPHMHYEVFPSLSMATSSSSKLATSQVAVPEDVCREVYATDTYAASLTNLGRVSLASDNVFRDGWDLQTPTVSGSVSGGILLDQVVAVRV